MEKLKKPMLIACGGFIILFIFMFIFSSCNKRTYTSEEFSELLLEKAKNYYEYNKSVLPQVDGGKVSMGIINLIQEQEDYLGETNICNGNIDVINNNGYYMYIPNISCSDGYVTTKLSHHLTSPEKIVSSSNGLYQYNDYYIYRGDDVNNYLLFNNQLWRIVRINGDGSIRIIETNNSVKKIEKGNIIYKNLTRNSVAWDNRYNAEKNYNSGFNDFIHNGINSRIKDELDNIYNEYSEDIKGYILKQNLCIGKRSKEETINDGSIECSSVIGDQFVGLLQVNEFFNASLDTLCINQKNPECSNYNYLTQLNASYWSITSSSENSYEVYKIGNTVTVANASSSAKPKVVLHISPEVTFSKGEGTKENPYIIN